MTEVPVDGINMADWWQIKALSVEWLYVVDKLSKTVKDYNLKEPQYIIGVSIGDNVPLYMLRRSIFPAEVLSAVTGLEVAALKQHNGIIILKSKPTGLPEPTVNYWGTA